MKNHNIDSNDLTVNPLDTETWPDVVRIVEKHNGFWEGCWSLSFHQKGTGTQEGNKAVKRVMVCEGKISTALVFEGAPYRELRVE